MFTALALVVVLVVGVVSLVGAIIARRRGNRALNDALSDGIPRRACDRCGCTDLELSGSTYFCPNCQAGG